MDRGLLIHMGLLVVALAALFYWVLVAPIRARRKRHAAMGPGGGRGAAWHPHIYEGRRNR